MPLPYDVDVAVDGGLLLQCHIAPILGVSRQRVSQLADRDDFPAPAKVIGRHRLWRRGDVEAWLHAQPVARRFA